MDCQSAQVGKFVGKGFGPNEIMCVVSIIYIANLGFRSSFRDYAAEQIHTPHAVMEAALAHAVRIGGCAAGCGWVTTNTRFSGNQIPASRKFRTSLATSFAWSWVKKCRDGCCGERTMSVAAEYPGRRIAHASSGPNAL